MARTKGNLNGFTIREETTYGVFDTDGDSLYGGTLKSLDDGNSVENIEDDADGVRTFIDVVAATHGYGFTADLWHPRNSGWNRWITYATGNPLGPVTEEDIPSFSVKCNVASNEKLAYFGCKVDKLKITAEKRGNPIRFNITAKARYMAKPSATDTFNNCGTSVSFASASRPQYAPIVYCAPVTIRTDASTSKELKAKSWSITIDNGLEGDPDAYIDVSKCTSLEAGAGSTPTKADITFEATIPSTDAFWDTLAYDDGKDIEISATIDGVGITLTGCYITSGMPNRSQSKYDETITFKASNIEVAE